MRARRFSSAELFALLVSIASVTISVLGNRTQERLLAASVWPYLSFASGNTSDDGQKQVVTLEVTNSGNGPARIKRFTLEQDGVSIASASALLERCCALRPDNVITSPIVGKVLRPADKVMLLQVRLRTPAPRDGTSSTARASVSSTARAIARRSTSAGTCARTATSRSRRRSARKRPKTSTGTARLNRHQSTVLDKCTP